MNKLVLSFIGGIAATVASSQFVKSGAARKVAVKTVATGIKAKDATVAAVTSVKEDAQDIVEEARTNKG